MGNVQVPDSVIRGTESYKKNQQLSDIELAIQMGNRNSGTTSGPDITGQYTHQRRVRKGPPGGEGWWSWQTVTDEYNESAYADRVAFQDRFAGQDKTWNNKRLTSSMQSTNSGKASVSSATGASTRTSPDMSGTSTTRRKRKGTASSLGIN